MSRTFVCGDLHGNFRALKEVLDRASFHAEKDTLITIGDYIDGGKHIEVYELMEFLMSLNNWIGIIGNHDYWLIETLEADWNYIVDNEWLNHGGVNTLRSLGVQFEKEENKFRLLNKPSIMVNAFCKRLSYYYVDNQQNLYVHAGYDHKKGKIEDHDFKDLDVIYQTIWDREFWKIANTFKTSIYNKIYIGHSWKTHYPELRGQVWNLDSGAGYFGRLSLIEVESDKVWKSSRTPKLYKNFGLR